MDLDVSKVHKDSISEYIYNALEEEQLYEPFIDIELDRRIRRVCEKIYTTAYKDALETKELENEKDNQSMTQDINELIKEIDDSVDLHKSLDKIEEVYEYYMNII